MKIVQSFWSKPALTPSHSYWGRNSGGWNSQRYHLLSWALSCLSIKRQYPNIELVTDVAGKELLINKIKLPYERVLTPLDKLNSYDSHLFSVGKVYTYSIQEEPFLHLDSDVFIWDQFGRDVVESPLVSQNIEVNFEQDVETLKDINLKFDYIPSDISYFSSDKNHISSNAGILGGSDIDFIKSFTEEAFIFIRLNQHKIEQLRNPVFFNIIFEQYLFTCMARKQNKTITYFLQNIDKDYSKVLCSFELQLSHKFIHVIGPCKKDKKNEEAIEKKLLLEFPEYYYRITKLFENNGI